MKKCKYFAESEFKRCDPPCSMQDMDAGFLALLDEVRERAGIPLVLNCAYRSIAHDKAKGRTGNSAHCLGMAVDIRCLNSGTRWKIIRAALACGITRIGVGKTFVHIDVGERKGLPPCVIWDYYN